MNYINELLAFCVKNQASDLHLSAGMPPLMRVDGDLRPCNAEILSPNTLLSSLLGIMKEHQQVIFKTQREVDFPVEIKGFSRFRVNVFWQNRGAAGVFRVIPERIKSLDELEMPHLKHLTNYKQGLVLVTGLAGTGKSTTLAAMVDEINTRDYKHILSIEDPIEFIHTSKNSLINQREVPRDSLSFANALRVALREDPNIILIGELRDLETIRLALTAAETGHLVLATLHTPSAAKTIDRIINVFPADEQAMIRTMLSESLRAVVSQVLLKKSIGSGRLVAQEIMLCNTAIRNLIRENKIPQMYSVMQTNRDQGMKTLDTHLSQLIEQNLVDWKEASLYANRIDVLAAFKPK